MSKTEYTSLPATQQIIIRRSQLKSVVGLSASHVDRMERSGTFPARRRFGPGTVGWLYSEILEWSQNGEVINSKFSKEG